MLDRIWSYIEAHAGELLGKAIAAVVVLVVIGALTLTVARVAERMLRKRGVRGATLATIVKSVLTLIGLTVAVVMALSQLGINVATVLAGAGVVGLAVGFGAQTLVKDCISGFFLILDDVVEVGDLVEVDGHKGTIERVGLRVTQLRAFSGQLWYLPNGVIEKVGNFNRAWNRAEVRVGLAYEADVTRALEVLTQAGATWAAANPELSVDKPVAQGVLELGDSTVVMRLIAKIKPGKIMAAELELRRRVKEALDAAGLEMSYPKRVVYVRPQGEDGDAVDAESAAEQAAAG